MLISFVYVSFPPEQLEGEEKTTGKYLMEFSKMMSGIQILVDELCSNEPINHEEHDRLSSEAHAHK